eukprot:1732102-Pyramimonas_sp.AAC.3
MYWVFASGDAAELHDHAGGPERPAARHGGGQGAPGPRAAEERARRAVWTLRATWLTLRDVGWTLIRASLWTLRATLWALCKGYRRVDVKGYRRVDVKGDYRADVKVRRVDVVKGDYRVDAKGYYGADVKGYYGADAEGCERGRGEQAEAEGGGGQDSGDSVLLGGQHPRGRHRHLRHQRRQGARERHRRQAGETLDRS